MREIEEKIVADYGLADSPDFAEQLKLSIARQLERGELEKHGRQNFQVDSFFSFSRVVCKTTIITDHRKGSDFQWYLQLLSWN